VADLLRLDPSQVVALTNDLQSRGYLRKVSSLDDRRSKVVLVTAAGRAAHAAARVDVVRAEEKFFGALTDTERRNIGAALRRLVPTNTEQDG